MFVVCFERSGGGFEVMEEHISLTHWRPEDSYRQSSIKLLNHFFCQCFAESVGVRPFSIFPVSALNFETCFNQY
jgi:hypothetical protein